MNRLVVLVICLAICSNDQIYFNGLTKEQFKEQYLGQEVADLSHIETADYDDLLFDEQLPDNYNFLETHEKCRTQVRNQQSCGSYWAFSGASVLANRFCKQTNYTVTEPFSAQFMINCDKIEKGCKGGRLDTEWQFLMESGTTSDDCNPYRSGSGFTGFYCDYYQCEDGSPIKVYKAQKGTLKAYRKVESIKREIYNNGPLQTSFAVYDDFPHYQKDSVYVKKSKEYMGQHMVKVVGWGKKDGMDYWVAENSWGTEWGNDGYFNIKMGECYFDYALVAAQPSIESLVL